MDLPAVAIDDKPRELALRKDLVPERDLEVGDFLETLVGCGSLRVDDADFDSLTPTARDFDVAVWWGQVPPTLADCDPIARVRVDPGEGLVHFGRRSGDLEVSAQGGADNVAGGCVIGLGSFL
jgi:hypothetical protein